MKKVKHLDNKIKMIAVFAAGLAVATLGWWQSDRLDLAYGQSSGINEVGAAKVFPDQECNPSEGDKTVRKYEDCRVVETVTKCNPSKRYVSYVKTKNGLGVVVRAMPAKKTREEIVYTKSQAERNMEVKTEVSRLDQEIAAMRKGKLVSELAKDRNYLAKVEYKNELDQVVRTNPRCNQRQTTDRTEKTISEPVKK